MGGFSEGSVVAQQLLALARPPEPTDAPALLSSNPKTASPTTFGELSPLPKKGVQEAALV